MPLTPATSTSLWRYPAALAIVAASSGAAEVLYRVTENTRLSMVFLAGVLVTAFLFGSGPAYFAAGAAFLVYNFYLVEPRFTFSFEAEDAATLAIFLAVAMLTGHLTGRIRDEAKRARARARTTQVLLDATRDFSASDDEAVVRERLARRLGEAAKGKAVVRDAEAAPRDGGPGRAAVMEAFALARAGRLATTRADGWALRPLWADGAPQGVAAWRSDADQVLGPDEHALLDILVDTAAAAIARARLAAAKTDAETRARTEALRNALLSSVSHDLRTPLAAIMASASSLQEFGETFTPEVRNDLAATIQEEAVRLDAFVANLLNMTRLEAGALAAQRIVFSVPEVVERTLSRHGGASGRRVSFRAPGDLPEAVGDPVLFEQALGNVVENALRYAAPGRPVEVSARAAADRLEVEVRDEGAGVAEPDLERIFEKFFRAAEAARRPGAGLGLSITRGLMEGMGGGVSARNRSDGVAGLAVTMTLPAAA